MIGKGKRYSILGIMDDFRVKGSCHCQAVKFEVDSYAPYPFLRCFCSICRKTAGGGGFAINIMGEAHTLKVTGKREIKIYHAVLGYRKNGKKIVSSGQRHFCKKCGTALWVSDKRWPKWIYPFASAIDSPLPKPKEHVNIMLKYAANWVEIPKGKKEHNFEEYNDESLLNWHKRHHLYKM